MAATATHDTDTLTTGSDQVLTKKHGWAVLNQ